MRQRWLSKRALLLHVALLIWFPGCLLAFWWQVHRAFSGNGLSYLYSVEWPVFAVTGVWAWWQLVHTDPATVGRLATERLAAARRTAAGPVSPTAAPAAAAASHVAAVPVRHREEEDEELAAYNDRLARLAAEGPKTWRRR